jgi:cell division protein ZapA
MRKAAAGGEGQMSHVSVTINGRLYRMACDDGQEEHLTRLGRDLDARIGQLKGAFGEIGDMRLTVMAALMVSDELVEAQRRVRILEQEIEGQRDARLMQTERAEQNRLAMAASLLTAAERIEKIAASLNRSIGETVPAG